MGYYHTYTHSNRGTKTGPRIKAVLTRGGERKMADGCVYIAEGQIAALTAELKSSKQIREAEKEMRRFRQWLADTNRMTESPDGTHYLVSDVEKMEAEKDRVIQESCVIIAKGIKVVENLEQQIAALAMAVKEKDEVIEAFEAMKEGVTERISDLEAAVHEWQDIAGQWEDKCQKLTEQIAALQKNYQRLS